MAAARDAQQISRPLSSGHRPSASSGASGSTGRIPQARSHSHSLSVGSVNPTHRVSRRKSSSNNAAAMAAWREATGASRHIGKGSVSKFGSPLQPNSLPAHESTFDSESTKGASVAVIDGPSLASLPGYVLKGIHKSRRASEGSRLSKTDARRQHAPDLKCDKCGKGYKHSSCLTKHLWEHTPEWAITSKLLISKHQQVQLLEAASVLVAMNADGPIAVDSDHSVSSPAASGSSDLHEDGMSSVDTTPPPDSNALYTTRSALPVANRHSSNSSAYSHSYQSVFSEVSNGRPYMSHYRQQSNEGRPTTSGTSIAGSYIGDDEQADLAAAVGLLSCSHGSQGTPKHNAVMLPADVPPVPPLPAKYSGFRPDVLSASTTTITPQYQSATGKNYTNDTDVDMHERGNDDHDSYRAHVQRSYEEDHGLFFGKMEE